MKLEQQYTITQKVIRKLISKNFTLDTFGVKLTIKICYFKYANNRTRNIWNMAFRERVWIYSKTELNDSKKKEIELFLIDKLESFEKALTGKLDREVIGVECVFVCPI